MQVLLKLLQLCRYSFVYNTTLRGETTGPLIYMILAMPEVVKRKEHYYSEKIQKERYYDS